MAQRHFVSRFPPTLATSIIQVFIAFKECVLKVEINLTHLGFREAKYENHLLLHSSRFQLPAARSARLRHGPWHDPGEDETTGLGVAFQKNGRPRF